MKQSDKRQKMKGGGRREIEREREKDVLRCRQTDRQTDRDRRVR